MFDKLINNKKLEKRKKKVIMEQLVLLSKLGQNGDQASRDGSEKKKKSKQKLRLKLENVCQNCGGKKYQDEILECSKHKNKKEQDGKSESANFTVNNLHLVERKDLDKRKIKRMLMMRENISRKELLLDCSATAYMFDK